MTKYIKNLVFLWVLLTLWLMPLSVMAIGVEDLTCQALSGQWQGSGETLRLEGALCRGTGDNYDFYRFDFDSKSVGFAPHTSTMDAPNLRFLYAHNSLFLYADGKSIYGVSAESFKVVWQRPWANVEMAWGDHHDNTQVAVLEKTAETQFLHVLRLENGSIVEAFSIDVEELLDVAWLPARLVILESKRLRWSTRLTDTHLTEADEEDGVTRPEASGVPSLSIPVGYGLSRATHAGAYHIDQYGVMTTNARMVRIYYNSYHLGGAGSTYATNATARVRAVSGSLQHAMAVTTDMLLVRIVARFGPMGRCERLGTACWGALSMRYEAKYWKVSQDENIPIIMASEETMALDGGSDNRAQTVDTRDPMRWRRMALVDYGRPGRLGYVRNDELISLHDEGPDALIRWRSYTGKKTSSLPRTALESIENAQAFGQIASIQSLEHADQYDFLFGQDGRYVVLDRRDMSLSKAYEDPKGNAQKTGIQQVIAKTENGFAIAAGQQEQGVVAWDIFDFKKNRLQLSELANAKISELQSYPEKWYGYCADEKNCFIAPATDKGLAGIMPEATLEESSHSASVLAWLVALISVFVMIVVTMWRRGVGKKSQIEQISREDNSLSSVSIELLDHKNRRFVTERDRKYFLCTHVFSNLFFRMGISLILGLGISLAVTYRYYFDDSLEIFISWIVILGMPVLAMTWIVSSWTYWNRLNLLTFGRLVEGSWRNCAKPMQSIVYSPAPGQSFELKRNQWKRADFVPIILFDPVAPDFAVQYTGEYSFPLSEHYSTAETLKPARTYDFWRLSVVVLGLGLCVFASQYFFSICYPNPLGSWELDRIEAKSQDSQQAFVTLCLEKCRTGSELCPNQCQHRQMRIVFKQAGVDLNSDPVLSPAKLLEQQKNMTSEMRQLLEKKGESCQAIAQEITDLPVWPKTFSQAFWSNYGQPQAYQASGIKTVHQAILDDNAHFALLCSDEDSCAKDPSKCPAPPACAGDVADLKARVCAFQRSLEETLQ